MLKKISLSEPLLAGNEWKYIKDCLDSGWVSSVGKFVPQFAEEFARFLDVPHAVPVVNGTAALHVSLIALGLKSEEEVLVPALTFAATANSVIYCNAFPVFMDVEPETLCLDVEKVERFLTHECRWNNGSLINKFTSRKVRGVIPVHLYGHPANMSPILDLAKKYGLFVLEDSTESLGSKYKGQSTGTLGEVGVFSFNGNKLITTGSGGMAVTKDLELACHVEYLTNQAKKQGDEYYHTEIGYNYRLTNIQAALGLAQLENIEQFIAKRRSIAHYYQHSLRDVPGVSVSGEAEWAFNVYWLPWILLETSYKVSKDDLLKKLNDNGVKSRAFFIPLHTLPPYHSYQAYQVSNAIDFYNRGINLPSHGKLGEDDLEFIVDLIK